MGSACDTTIKRITLTTNCGHEIRMSRDKGSVYVNLGDLMKSLGEGDSVDIETAYRLIVDSKSTNNDEVYRQVTTGAWRLRNA